MRKLDEEDTALLDRVLGLLVLLYAQPPSRIRWLTLDDVGDGQEMTIRLGDLAAPGGAQDSLWAAKRSEGDLPPQASPSSTAEQPLCGNSSSRPRRRSSST